MKNKKRSPDYIAHKHLINGCESYRELIAIEFLINKFAAPGTDEGRDLLLLYNNRRAQLSLEPDFLKYSIESQQHKFLSK